MVRGGILSAVAGSRAINAGAHDDARVDARCKPTLHRAVMLELFNWILHFSAPVNGVHWRTD